MVKVLINNKQDSYIPVFVYSLHTIYKCRYVALLLSPQWTAKNEKLKASCHDIRAIFSKLMSHVT